MKHASSKPKQDLWNLNLAREAAPSQKYIRDGGILGWASNIDSYVHSAHSSSNFYRKGEK